MLANLARLTLAVILLLLALWLEQAWGVGPPANQSSATSSGHVQALAVSEPSPAMQDCQRLLAALEESARSQRQERLYQLIQQQARRP